MNIDKQQNGQNKLVKDLIDLTISVIEINNQELIDDTFRHPSRGTITYAILFDPSLNSLPIHKKILDRLSAHLIKWEKGVFAIDIYIWRDFSEEQARIVQQIWTLVAQSVGKQYELDRIFKSANEDLKNKLEIKERVMICINTYCQQASDKDKYMKLLQEIHEHLEQVCVQSVKIALELEEILLYTEKLNPYAKTISWQTFLDRKRTGKGKIQELY